MPRPVIAELLRLTPNPDNLDHLADYLGDHRDELLATTVRARAVVGPRVDLAPDLAADLEPDIAHRQEDLVDLGARALRTLRESGPDAEISDEEALGLEAIVNLALRPALLMRKGEFEPPEVTWRVLETFRDSIRDASSRVGRIQLANPGFGAPPYLGTGFLVGDGVIMTNGHVARAMRMPDGSYPPGRATLDFTDNPDAGGSTRVDIVEMIGVHPGYPPRPDLALFRADVATPPFVVRSVPPEPLTGRVVYVMGYPARDDRNEADAMRRVFADIYNVKRLQPGGVMSYDHGNRTFRHDCSTLGGNSGSCVVDLESNQVLGLHFGGIYLKHNEAVALWALRDDPLLVGAGVEFD
ncbi:trypsin-like serine peptidase [Saccharothrix deserti]|uniref:trypsin-like serine peptidase n=1 Tax=Saccharothrix deserti TaxID=2593674 RepID=UPI00131B8BEC|nr:serine protease [Saccharothrix deserti]